MNKDKFREIILDMEYPILMETDLYGYELLNCVIMLKDKISTRKKYKLQVIKLLINQLTKEGLNKYFDRERKAKQKYERWMYEYCGNCCESKLKIDNGRYNIIKESDEND